MPLDNRELFLKLKEAQFELNGSLESFVLEHHGQSKENISEEQFLALRNFLEKFAKAAKIRWKTADRSQQKLDKKYTEWLSESISIPELKGKGAGSSKGKGAETSKGGRPAKDFSELSKRSRDRSTVSLRGENSGEKLLHAATVKLRDDGQGDFASIIADCQQSPTRPAKLRRLSGAADSLDRVPKTNIALPTPVSPEAAAAFLLGQNLTKETYIAMRTISKENNADIWPPYPQVAGVKEDGRPANIQYGETAVKVDLPDRLAKNDSAFMELYETEIGQLLGQVELGGTLRLECEGKVGFDGSSGHSIYNQKFSLENRDVSDSNLLASCYVPLQYRVAGGEPVFTNPCPQSAAFCQPLRLEFRKETKEASVEIDRYIVE